MIDNLSINFHLQGTFVSSKNLIFSSNNFKNVIDFQYRKDFQFFIMLIFYNLFHS